MNVLTLDPPKKHFTFAIQMMVTLVFVLFLIYIDEGNYSFPSFFDIKNLIGLLIGVGLFSIGQMIAKVYLFKKEYKLWISILIGFVGIAIDLAGIFIVGGIAYLFT
jgi:hypothetical protein